MTRSELEHLIRAAGAISGDRELVIIGGQSILGQHPDAPRILRASTEADLYPRNHPERADLVDGAIGEGSRFHEEYGYCAQGAGKRTALPAKLGELVRSRIAWDFAMGRRKGRRP